jgi:hypothetical protein
MKGRASGGGTRNTATSPIELLGTLTTNGTLVLDQRPHLPPGRARVTLLPLADLAQTPVWQALDRIWAEQRARGHVPRSREEIDADVAAMRPEDEERAQHLERTQEECRRARKTGSSTGDS